MRLRPALPILVLALLALPLMLTERAWAQSPIGSEFQVNTYTTDFQYQSSVAVADDGAFVVVWDSRGQDGDSNGIFAQRHSSDGQRLGVEFQVNSYTTGDQRLPDVAPTPSGFVVAWGDSQRLLVLAKRYASDGSVLGSEITVNTDSDVNSPGPALATTGSGSFLVTWENASNAKIFSRLFAADGTPVNASQQLLNSDTATTNSGSQPIALPNGEFRVIWNNVSGGPQMPNGPTATSKILGRKLDSSGVPTGSEFTANSSSTGLHDSPAIAATDNGFTVVWTSDDQLDGSGRISGQRLQNDGTWVGGEFVVSSQTTGYQYRPRITPDKLGGGFVVVWGDSNYPSPSTIQGRHFDASATPTASFQVNTSTSNTSDPDVDSAADGSFVVSWDGYSNSSGLDIKGRRFTGSFLFVDGFESGDASGWSLSQPPITTPSGDFCSDALTLPEGSLQTGDLIDNTASGVTDSCGSGNFIDEWHAYTATCTGTVTVTTCRPITDVDTVLSSWDGCGGTELACNDDDDLAPPECDLGGNNRKSTVLFAVTSGQTYFIRTSAFSDDFSGGSTFGLEASCQ